MEKHLHYLRVNQVKASAEGLPVDQRAKYEQRARDHVHYLAKLALDLSMEGQADAVRPKSTPLPSQAVTHLAIS